MPDYDNMSNDELHGAKQRGEFGASLEAGRRQVYDGQLSKQSSSPGGSSYSSAPASGPAPVSALIRFIAVWAAIIWAFFHVPFLTQGIWSGPALFTLIIGGLLLTPWQQAKGYACCLMPFTLLGAYMCFMMVRSSHHTLLYPSRPPMNRAHKTSRTITRKPNTRHTSAHKKPP